MGFLVKSLLTSMTLYQNAGRALARVARLVEHCPVHQKVMSSIPGQGIHLGCRFSPQSGCVEEATNWCFSLTSVFFSPFLSKINFKKCLEAI